MKTAEAWSKQLDLESTDDFNQKRQSWNSIDFIKQIQLDAMKEGMRRAAIVIPKSELPKGLVEGTQEAYHWSNGFVVATTDKHKAILSAAEQLTEKDL